MIGPLSLIYFGFRIVQKPRIIFIFTIETRTLQGNYGGRYSDLSSSFVLGSETTHCATVLS